VEDQTVRQWICDKIEKTSPGIAVLNHAYLKDKKEIIFLFKINVGSG
jgi:hypothetical protein